MNHVSIFVECTQCPWQTMVHIFTVACNIWARKEGQPSLTSSPSQDQHHEPHGIAMGCLCSVHPQFGLYTCGMLDHFGSSLGIEEAAERGSIRFRLPRFKDRPKRFNSHTFDFPPNAQGTPRNRRADWTVVTFTEKQPKREADKVKLTSRVDGQQESNLLFTTKLVFPKSLKSRNSGSE